jgi:predicted transcriptional regulator
MDKKDKSRNKFCERVRIIVAKEIDVPPDDIDMFPIIDCVERAIKISCEKDDGEMVISFKNKREEKAILSDSGKEILKMIFNDQAPFINFISDYQEWCASNYLKNIYRDRDIE